VCPEPDQSGPRPRVLVVDDHPIWRQGVADGLEDAGFLVAGTAGDGAQALRVATATRPGVVLLDLNLPDMSGAEVTRRLLAADPGIRVLILSASGERQDVLDAMTAGATGYLVKSAQFSELVSAVRSVAAGEAVFTPGLAGLVLGEYRRLAAGAGSRAGAAGAGPPGSAVAAGATRGGVAAGRADGTGVAGGGVSAVDAVGAVGAVDAVDAVGAVGAGVGAEAAGPARPRLTERETEVLRLVAKGMTYPEIAALLVLSPRTVQNHVQNTLIKLQLHNKAQLVRYALEQGLD
jgi:DNA-binding NarL/FixJ family response regulator